MTELNHAYRAKVRHIMTQAHVYKGCEGSDNALADAQLQKLVEALAVEAQGKQNVDFEPNAEPGISLVTQVYGLQHRESQLRAWMNDFSSNQKKLLDRVEALYDYHHLKFEDIQRKDLHP